MKEINWETANDEQVKEYLVERHKETLAFAESIKVPLANLTSPQEGAFFDAIADEIERAAPNAEAAYVGLRLFGRRNSELRRLAEQKNTGTEH